MNIFETPTTNLFTEKVHSLQQNDVKVKSLFLRKILIIISQQKKRWHGNSVHEYVSTYFEIMGSVRRQSKDNPPVRF